MIEGMRISWTGDGGGIPIYKEPAVWLMAFAALCLLVTLIQQWEHRDMLWRIPVAVVGVAVMIAFSIPFLLWLVLSVPCTHAYHRLRGHRLTRDGVGYERWV